MLEIVSRPALPSDGDLCFVFNRYDAIGNLMDAPGTPWQRAALKAEFPKAEEGVFLGLWRGVPAYAVGLHDAQLDPMRHVSGSLYTLLGRIDDALFGAYGRALQMLRWRAENQYCGRCGEAMLLGDGERAMVCGQCQLSRYPQLAPCAIVLVTRGREMLLAQAAGRGPGFYSTLAGFIEPGESAEEAVAREVEEEVGVKVTDIRYFGSQPWPFPGQLMLGFTARYDSGEIQPDPEEIADAQWFTADALPPVPPAVSISGQLIRSFIQQEALGD
ncbi:MAG: NAD(+) diphosphatase [Halieaceae bacterium]|jgi:NAD+ diphosphatase|nr:NAD(+) diphosphatase [Halieaceae bacterium]